MKTAIDVFVSYKSELHPIVEEFVKRIEGETIDGHQVRCWYAPRNLDENATEDDFDDAILEAIKECCIAVAFINDAALCSRWVKLEIDQAWERGKFILPTAVEEITLDNAVMAKLSSKHRINAYPDPLNQMDKVVTKALAQLRKSTAIEQDVIKVVTPIKTQPDFYLLDSAKALEEAGEFHEAVKNYLQLALQGNKESQQRLCELFYNHGETLGEICSGEETDIIRQQADINHQPWACFLMHCLYYSNSQYYDVNNDKSFFYVQQACADSSIPIALLRLGIHYGWGLGTQLDNTLELLYYKKAFQAGCREACSYLGQKYEFGDEKQEDDQEQAERYYQKGVELGDVRSMKHLTRLYIGEGELEKALKVANQMIDDGISYGYILKGEIAFEGGQSEEGIKMYKKAIQLDEYEGYSSLALYYWDQDNHDEAYRLAQKGCKLNDKKSFLCLGWFQMYDGQYEEAWNNLLIHFQRTCGDSASLGDLFFEYGFRKDDPDEEEQMEQQLLEMLEIGARNNDEQSMNYLLRLLSYRETGNADPAVEDLIHIPKAIEMVKIGAQMRMPSAMYYYGIMLMSDDYAQSNPLKGLKILQDAALTGNENALDYLFEYGQEGKYAKDVDLPLLSFHTMIYSDKAIDSNLRFMGLQHAIHILSQNPDEWIKRRCREIIDLMREEGSLGYVKRLGEDLLLFYPDYDELAERQIFLKSGDVGSLYYIINYASEYENNVKVQDYWEKRASYELKKIWFYGIERLNELNYILCVRYHMSVQFVYEKPNHIKYEYIPSREAQRLNADVLRGIIQFCNLFGDQGEMILQHISDSDTFKSCWPQLKDFDDDLMTYITLCVFLHEEAMKVIYNNSEMERTIPMDDSDIIEQPDEEEDEVDMPTVYICYNEGNRSIADDMVKYLEDRGLSCWYSGRNETESDDRLNIVTDVIDNCKMVIAVLDNDAVQNKQVIEEMELVWERKKPIVPFVLERIDVRNNLMARIKKYKIIYAYPHPEFYYEEVQSRIEKWLERIDENQ